MRTPQFAPLQIKLALNRFRQFRQLGHRPLGARPYETEVGRSIKHMLDMSVFEPLRVPPEDLTRLASSGHFRRVASARSPSSQSRHGSASEGLGNLLAARPAITRKRS